MPGARRSLGRGRAQGEQGRHHPRSRRPGRHAVGRGIRAQEHAELPRLLRRLFDGTAADRSRPHRTDAAVQTNFGQVIREGKRQ